MAKGYWIAHVEVRDPEGYKDYVAAARIAFDKYGAKMLARGGAYEQTEGRDRPATWSSSSRRSRRRRTATTRRNTRRPGRSALKYAEAEMVLVEGVDG